MNPRSSNWTGRVPRTLEQAFGAHASTRISEPAQQSGFALWACTFAAAALAAACIVVWGVV
jgi:hypothetical protein